MNEPRLRHKQGKMYDNEEDRRNANLESKRKYAAKKMKCESCNSIVTLGHKPRHEKSKKHMKSKNHINSE